MAYIGLPIETDGNRLAADILDKMMSTIPGWVPREGHLEVWIIEAIANALAEVLGVASRIDRGIFRFFGQSLIGLAPIDGAPASCPTTWTLTDSLGHTIPAGTTVAFRTSGGVLVPFVTISDVVVTAGSSATGAGAVTVYSPTNGAGKNGFVAGTMVVVDRLSFLSGVVSTATTTGGTDPETDDEYLGRLVDELALMAPRPILAADFATYSRKVAGVARATGLDNYNPAAGGSFGNEKMVTIAMIDEAGANVSAAIKTAAATLFASVRELNFVVNIVDPTRTTINIAYVVKALPGKDVNAIMAAIDAALKAFISPANWGSMADDPAQWNQTGTVRYLSVAEVILSIPGVAYITTLTVNTTTADVALTGVITLPTVGTVGGTVS